MKKYIKRTWFIISIVPVSVIIVVFQELPKILRGTYDETQWDFWNE